MEAAIRAGGYATQVLGLYIPVNDRANSPVLDRCGNWHRPPGTALPHLLRLSPHSVRLRGRRRWWWSVA